MSEFVCEVRNFSITTVSLRIIELHLHNQVGVNVFKGIGPV